MRENNRKQQKLRRLRKMTPQEIFYAEMIRISNDLHRLIKEYEAHVRKPDGEAAVDLVDPWTGAAFSAGAKGGCDGRA